MLLGGFAAVEGAEVSPFAGLLVLLARIEAVLARFQFADHAFKTDRWPVAFPFKLEYIRFS